MRYVYLMFRCPPVVFKYSIAGSGISMFVAVCFLTCLVDLRNLRVKVPETVFSLTSYVQQRQSNGPVVLR